MTQNLKEEQQEITAAELEKILKEKGIAVKADTIKEALPKIESAIEHGNKLKKKAEDIQKLILPSITKQNRIAKAVYDARKQGELLGLKLNSFPEIQRALEGLQDGFYLIGADTNMGKSALSHNLCLDVLRSNPDAIALYFSLDDSAEDILTRMRANIAEVEINQVKAPWKPGNKVALDKAYKTLDDLENRLFILDQEQVATFENLTHFMEEAIVKNKGKKLVVFIDAILNLDVEEDPLKKTIRELNITRANKLKALVKKYSLPLICTVELKKRKDNDERPTLGDIMETGKYAYNANVVMLLHATAVDMTVEETKVELIFAKNKLSHFKGSLALTFYRKRARIEEQTYDTRPIGKL